MPKPLDSISHVPVIRASNATEAKCELLVPVLGADEIAITRRGLRHHFVGGQKAHLDKITKRFPEGAPVESEQIRDYHADKIVITVEGTSISLERRFNTPKYVWAVPVSYKQTLAIVFDLTVAQEIPLISSTQIALSRRALSQNFVGDGSQLLAQVYKRFPVGVPTESLAIVSYSESKVEMDISGETFLLQKVRSGAKYLWAIARSDRSRLGKALNFKVREHIPVSTDDRIELSSSGLSRYFAGKSSRLVERVFRNLSRDIPTDSKEIQAFHQDSVQVKINDEVFVFERRLNQHANALWTIPIVDKGRLAKACGLIEKTTIPSIDRTLIALSGPGLEEDFIGEGHEKLHRIQQFFPENVPITSEAIRIYPHDKIEVRVGPEQFMFVKVSPGGGQFVWAFKAIDIIRLASALKLTLRTEATLLQADEIAVSPTGLFPHFVGDPSKMRDSITAVLPPDNGTLEESED